MRVQAMSICCSWIRIYLQVPCPMNPWGIKLPFSSSWYNQVFAHLGRAGVQNLCGDEDPFKLLFLSFEHLTWSSQCLSEVTFTCESHSHFWSSCLYWNCLLLKLSDKETASVPVTSTNKPCYTAKCCFPSIYIYSWYFWHLWTPREKKLFNEKDPGFSSTKGPEMWIHKKWHKVDWLSKQNQRKKLKGSLRKAQPLLSWTYNGCHSMKRHYTHAQNFFLKVAKALEQPAYENALVHMFLVFL